MIIILLYFHDMFVWQSDIDFNHICWNQTLIWNLLKSINVVDKEIRLIKSINVQVFQFTFLEALEMEMLIFVHPSCSNLSIELIVIFSLCNITNHK